MRTTEFEVTAKLVNSLLIGGYGFDSKEELVQEAISISNLIAEKING